MECAFGINYIMKKKKTMRQKSLFKSFKNLKKKK